MLAVEVVGGRPIPEPELVDTPISVAARLSSGTYFSTACSRGMAVRVK